MVSRVRAAVLAAVIAVAGLTVVAPPAGAAAILTITPTTWDIVGLDSNKPSVSNGRPNEFPIGAKVCNTGDAPATSVQAAFNWTTANSNLTLANATTTRTLGTLAPGGCAHATYNVLINRNQQSFNNRARGYQITATAAGGLSASTPANREVYVEKLVSQARNSVIGITSAACSGGSCTVYRGQTYRFTLTSKTATQGYEQLETFVNFPDSIFEIQDIDTRYAAPAGARNDKVYADACGWDPVTTSPTYRSCVGPTGYPSGKAGGNPIVTEYTVKVVGLGSGTLSGLVYDFSGSSFHYNADFGTGANAVAFTASDAADLSLTKTHTGAFVRGGTGTYRLTVSNAGPATSGAVSITDTLPPGLTYRSFSGTGWTCSGCSASSQTVTLTRAGLASDASSWVDLTVDIGAGAASSLTNTATVSQATTAMLNDPAPGNNAASDATTVANAGEADLVVTKTRPDVMTPGGEATYTIYVRNDAPGTVVGPVTMTDVLPQGLSYVSATGSGWTCGATGQTVTCTRPDNLAALEAAPPITLVVSVSPDAPARSTNRTSATGSTDNDPNDPNNVDVLDVVKVGSADLWIEKSHTGAFSRGGTGKYTIVVGNRGPNAAETPRVVDTLPAGLTFESATGTGWTCSGSGQTVTCDAATDLPAGSTAPALRIDVAIAAGAAPVVTNRATVCSVQQPSTATGCPDHNQGTTEVAASDNSAEDVTATTAPTDLALTKVASTTSVAAGTAFDYTLTVTNNGPNPATNVTIVDTLPVYIDPASITTSPGPSNTSTPPYCDVTNREVTCVMGTVSATAGANTATATITAKALPTAAGRTIVNSATVFSDLGDTAPGNDGASAPVSVTGALVNARPVAADKTLTVAHRSVTGADVVLSATDADGDPLTFELPSPDGGAVHGTVTISGNVATYVPDGDFTGTDTFQYRANDGAETSAPATVTVTVTNDAPSAQGRSASTPHLGAGTDIVLSGDDPDGDELTYVLEGTDGGAVHGTVTISGNVATYVPAGDFVGTDTFEFRTNDGAASSTPATVTVTLTNSAPTLASAAISPRSPGAGDTLTATAVSPADADGDDLTYTYVWKRTRGGDTETLETTTTASATDTLALSGAAAGDTIEVSITAHDGHAGSATRSDSVTVGNSAPTATAASATTDEDTSKTLTLTGNDPDGDALTYVVTSLPEHGTLFDGAGTSGSPISALPYDLAGTNVTYRPAPGYNGPDDFDFRTTDGDTASSPVAATLTVVPVNDAPAASAGTLTVAGGQSSGQLDLATLAADEETADGNLTYEVVAAPAGGTATIDGSTVTYTRTAPGRVDDSFTFKVVDRGDPDACGLPVPGTCTIPLDSNTAGITVSFANAAPVAEGGDTTTAEDTAVTITLSAIDADADDLTYSVASLPSNGTLHAGNDASAPAIGDVPAALPGTRVTYVPDADYNGADDFEFTASDGAASSTAAPVEVTVTPVNDRPDTADGTISVAGGQVSDSVNLATLADDVETADAALDYEVVSGPSSGTASITGSTLTYTRTAPGRDADSLTFEVTDRGDPDGCGTAGPGCDAARTSAPATISVTFGNAAPTAAGESATTPEDTPIAIELDGGDPDGDSLTYVITSLPSDGRLRSGGTTITALPFELAGRSVTYVPDNHYRGGDSFGFETSDGRLASDDATVSVTVTPVNDRPNANDGGIVVAAAAATAQLDLATLVGDVETADADLTYALVSQPVKGTASLTGSTLTYTRTAPGRDADQLTFKVTDRGDPDDCGTPVNGSCAAALESVAATVAVTFDYTRPTANPQDLETPEDTPLTVALTGSSLSDAGSRFEITTLPQHGALFQGPTELQTVPVELSGAGVVYVPDADYDGGDSFTFVRTGLQDSAPATVDVTVTPVNDAPVARDVSVDAPPATATAVALQADDVDSADLELVILEAPRHGTLGPITVQCSPAGAGATCPASVDYTPEAGYDGPDSFTYAAADRTDRSLKATVTINVPAGDAPAPTPTPVPTPTASPGPTPTPTPPATPEPTATPSPSPSPSQEPDPAPRCGDPIEVEANGEPIVGTPCGELITVHASVPATIEALGGNDTIFVFGSAEVHVSAGDGDDQVSCLETSATVLGGAGDDAIECGSLDHVVRGGPGADRIAAGDGNDRVVGGNGHDALDGGSGDDLLIGGRGQDDLFGGGGDDVLKGQGKVDVIRAGAGNDLLRGSRGNDVEYGGKGADRVQAGPGDDRIWGGRGSDRLQGNDGDDHIQGGGGDDLIRGRAGADVIAGRGGNDVIRGGGGDDVLRGVGGDDELQSGPGHNDIDGGLGVDKCVIGDKGNVSTGCELELKRRF